MIIWKTMCGRSVVENTGSKQSTTATNHYLTIHYTIPVVVWSKFLENKILWITSTETVSSIQDDSCLYNYISLKGTVL